MKLYARNGVWRDRSYLDDCRACGGCAGAVRHAAVAASDAHKHAQAGLSAVQANRDPGWENESDRLEEGLTNRV
jgi:hypothetical protein